MAGMIKSIFGLTGSDVQEARRKQNTAIQKNLARTNADPTVNAIAGAFGPKLGRMLAKKLGYEDSLDREARETAEKDEALRTALSKHTVGSSGYFFELAKAASSVGDFDAVASWMSKSNAATNRDLQSAKDATDLIEPAPEVLKAPTGYEFDLSFDMIEKSDLGFEPGSAEKSSYASNISQRLQQIKLNYEKEATADSQPLPTDDIIIADLIEGDKKTRLTPGEEDSKPFEFTSPSTWFDQETFTTFK